MAAHLPGRVGIPTLVGALPQPRRIVDLRYLFNQLVENFRGRIDRLRGIGNRNPVHFRHGPMIPGTNRPANPNVPRTPYPGTLLPGGGVVAHYAEPMVTVRGPDGRFRRIPLSQSNPYRAEPTPRQGAGGRYQPVRILPVNSAPQGSGPSHRVDLPPRGPVTLARAILNAILNRGFGRGGAIGIGGGIAYVVLERRAQQIEDRIRDNAGPDPRVTEITDRLYQQQGRPRVIIVTGPARDC